MECNQVRCVRQRARSAPRGATLPGRRRVRPATTGGGPARPSRVGGDACRAAPWRSRGSGRPGRIAPRAGSACPHLDPETVERMATWFGSGDPNANRVQNQVHTLFVVLQTSEASTDFGRLGSLSLGSGLEFLEGHVL